MASTFTLTHAFPDITVADFERHLNHPELIEMLKGMPAFRSRDLVEKKDLGGGAINWRFRVVAGGNVPAAARSVINDDMLTWFEDARFAPAEHTIYWQITPIKDKVRELLESKGTWRLIPDGAGTRRVIDGLVNIKIPFVGKVAEQFLVSELKRNYDVEPEIQGRFYRMMKARG